MKFDENLRNFRKEKDYSQEYLAEVMNVSRQTISKWENGTAMPDLKKLTELAELFETSMDELLGTSSPAPKADSFSVEELQGYAYIIAREQIDAYAKKNKTWQIITSVSIILLTIALLISIININNVSNNMANNPSSQIIYQDSDYEETITDFTKVFVSNVNKEDTRLAEVTFVYNPKTYAKGTTVSFSVKDMTSSQAEDEDIVAELMSNGQFVATKEINFAGFNSASIKVDDGTNITTETLEIDWAAIYHDFTDVFIDLNVEDNGATKTIDFFSNCNVRWGNNESMPSITEAYVEAKYGGKLLESKELKIQNDGVYSFVLPTNFNAKLDEFNPEKFSVQIKLVDEYGSRYYIDCIFIQLDNEVENPYNNLTIEFAHGGRLSMESYVEKEE